MKVWLKMRDQLIWGGILAISAGVGLLTEQELEKAGRLSDGGNIAAAFVSGLVTFLILTLAFAIVRAGSPDPQDQS